MVQPRFAKALATSGSLVLVRFGESLLPLRNWCRALRGQGRAAANTAGIAAYNDAHDGPAIEIRQRKYVNNMVERDHRSIKRRIRPKLGFQSFWTAKVVLGGNELVRMLRKAQLAFAADEAPMTAAEAFYGLAA